jgi:hypothetical protein
MRVPLSNGIKRVVTHPDLDQGVAHTFVQSTLEMATRSCSYAVLKQGDRMNALVTAWQFGLAVVPLAATAIPAQKPMIVLVRGAFADASS